MKHDSISGTDWLLIALAVLAMVGFLLVWLFAIVERVIG